MNKSTLQEMEDFLKSFHIGPYSFALYEQATQAEIDEIEERLEPFGAHLTLSEDGMSVSAEF